MPASPIAGDCPRGGDGARLLRRLPRCGHEGFQGGPEFGAAALRHVGATLVASD